MIRELTIPLIVQNKGICMIAYFSTDEEWLGIEKLVGFNKADSESLGTLENALEGLE